MRIIGEKAELGLYYVYALIHSKTFPELTIELMFYIDTGASMMAISDTDAINNNIPYRTLQLNPRPIAGIGKDHIYSRILPKCDIYLLKDDGKLYKECWTFLNILDRGDEQYAKKNPAISLLGINFLKKFNISFTDNFVTLEI